MSDEDSGQRAAPRDGRPSPYRGRPWWWWATAAVVAVAILASVILLSI